MTTNIRTRCTSPTTMPRPRTSAAARWATLSLLVLSSATRTARAQGGSSADAMCSCSPTVFTFILSLDQTCEDNTIAENGGIDGAFCFTEVGVSLPAPTPPPAPEDGDDEEEEPVRRRVQAATAAPDRVVEVLSVQFLEFDTSGDLTVINQDDTYADVSLGDGDRLAFDSASSFLNVSRPLDDQMSSPALVPGGASLILYGLTEGGVIVRNRFFWMYDMSCGRDNDPINAGDEIGWVTVSDTANAWPTFCPALPDGSPTIAPKTNEPTLTPTAMPTDPPSTKAPVTAFPTPRGSLLTGQPSRSRLSLSYDMVGMFGWSGKSAKSKAYKQKRTSESKSSKSESKSGKHTKEWHSDSSAKSSSKSKSGKTSYRYGMDRLRTYDVERSSDAASRWRSPWLVAVAACYLLVKQ